MPGRIAKTMGPLEWAFLITLSVLWGGTFFFAEVALREIRPLTLVFYRVGLAALALILMVHATGHRLPRSKALWGAFFVMGALNNLVPFSLIFWGQTRITGGLAAILNATTPLFTVVLAHFLTRDEKLTRNRFAGVVLGIAGVAIMIGPEALRELGFHLLAQIAVLGPRFRMRWRDLRKAVSGGSAGRERCRPGHRHDGPDAADRAPARAAVARTRAERADLGRDPGSRVAQHGVWLSDLLSRPGERGSDQSASRDLSDSGERHRSWLPAFSASASKPSISPGWR